VIDPSANPYISILNPLIDRDIQHDNCCSDVYQKSIDLIYATSEACNHARAFLLSLQGASEECLTKKIKIILESYKNVCDVISYMHLFTSMTADLLLGCKAL
jgi:hypothetical protein